MSEPAAKYRFNYPTAVKAALEREKLKNEKKKAAVALATAKKKPVVAAKKKTSAPTKKPAAAAASKKKKAKKDGADDEDEEGGGGEEDEKDLGFRKNETERLAKTLVHFQSLFKQTFSRARATVDTFPASKFEAFGVKPGMCCMLCKYAIFGSATRACRVTFDGTTIGEEQWKAWTGYFHSDCMVCCYPSQTSGKTCSETVLQSSNVIAGGQFCHLDRDFQPRCKNHIDTHLLVVPSFDPSAPDKMRNFMTRWGFVKVRSPNLTHEILEDRKSWLEEVVGLFSGWLPDDARETMKTTNWDIALQHIGKDSCEFGITGDGCRVEGDSVSNNKLRAECYNASIIQDARLWEVREAMMPCFEPFFGPKDNVMSSMAPPIVIARGTETTKNIGKLRSLLADKRVTGERTDKRSTPLTIINGIVSFAPSKSNVRIMVCPERWKEAGSEETFVERWLSCKEKEPNEGVFPKNFSLSGLTLPVHLDAGEAVLFRGTRPFSLDQTDDNFWGMFIGANNVISKVATTTVRVQLVLSGLVTKKEWTRCNHRYRKGLTRVQLGSAPDEFAGLNTPVTITTLHRYASSIMGTKKVNPEKWPLEYQPDTREFDPDPLIEAELDLPDDMDVD